jgi:hypothetical protein
MAKLISLKGATIKFNNTLTVFPDSINNTEHNGFYYSGSCIIGDDNFNELYGQYYYSDSSGYIENFNFRAYDVIEYYYTWRGDDGTSYYRWLTDPDGLQVPPTIINFDFPDLNENADFISWVSENATIDGGVWKSEHKTIIKNPICLVQNKVKKVVVDNANMTIDVYTKEVPE